MVDYKKQMDDNYEGIKFNLNACNTTNELYLLFYEYSKYYGPDIMFDKFEDLVINFYKPNEDGSIFARYANHIGYQG